MKQIKTDFFLIVFIFNFILCGCKMQPPVPTASECLTSEDIKSIIMSDYKKTPPIEEIKFFHYPEESFLFDNRCFAFYRDMDFFLPFSFRYDFLDSIITEYPPQAVRTIENNSQKSMYFVYETDKDTRIFVFFFEFDDFNYTRGFPIVMKKSLKLSDFSALKEGDSMTDVEKIDPVTPLYRKGYDTLSDELLQKIYVDGRETISTVHLLTDGMARIDYNRNSEGEYIIDRIIISDIFTIPMLGGHQSYLIYPEDYIS